MLKQSDDFELTEADIDMIIEAATGEAVKPANLAAGIASMCQRIAQLEAEKIKLLDRMDEGPDESLKRLRRRQQRPRHREQSAHTFRSATRETELNRMIAPE